MATETTSSSWLLRVWHEPREAQGAPAAVRGYLRSLKTGEEHYIGRPEVLAALVRSQVHSRGDAVSTEGEEHAKRRRKIKGT